MNYLIDDIVFDIEFEIKPKNKNIYYRLIYPNKLIIKLNRKYSDDKLNKLLDEIKPNLLSLYNKINNNHQEIKENIIHLLGKEYNLILTKSADDSIFQDDKNIYVSYKKVDNIKKLINGLYNDYLKSIVNKNIDDIKIRFNLKTDIKFEYKAVKTYFGECFIKENRIILASMLAKYEYKYILSVIYHEIAHLFYRGHQEDFYNLLEEVFPNYKKAQHELRKIRYYEKY